MSSRYQYEQQQKMQRLRVASGAPFARGSVSSMSMHLSQKHSEPSGYPSDFRNQRNSSNASRGGGGGRHSSGLTAAAAGSSHIHSAGMHGLQKKQTASATKHFSQNIVNQRSAHHMPPSSSHAAAAAAHHNSNRDNSVTSGHSMHQQHPSNSSFNNQITGLSMTSYQKVRTTQPSSVKHANESYLRSGDQNLLMASSGEGMRAPEQDDHAKNYN